MVLVNICAIDVAIPGFDCPHNLSQSVSVIYAHIRSHSTHRIFDLMKVGLPGPEPNLWHGRTIL